MTRLASSALLCAGCLTTPGMAESDARVIDAAHDAMTDASIQTCVTGFAGGTHANTTIDGGRLVMSDLGMVAEWTSPIVDSGEDHAWVLSWTPAIPSLKRLPPDGGADTGYLGGVDMTGNVLLYQFDETAGGLFADFSGNDLEGACANCPTLGASAVFNTGASFTADNSVFRADSALLQPAMVSIEAWSRKTGSHGTGTPGSAGSIVAKGHGPSEPFSSWSLEQVENVAGQQPRAMRCYLGHTGGGATALGTMGIDMAANFHTVCTYDGAAIRLYVNGALADTEPMAQGIDYALAGGDSTDLTIGTWGMVNQDFAGVVDVVAIYDRVLDENEVARRWLRGALRVFLQVKVCDDDACDGEDWVGPSGDASTSYSEYCNNGLGPPRDLPTNDLDCDRDGIDDDGITGSAVAPGRWAQMKIHLETADAAVGPEVLDASFCAVTP